MSRHFLNPFRPGICREFLFTGSAEISAGPRFRLPRPWPRKAILTVFAYALQLAC